LRIDKGNSRKAAINLPFCLAGATSVRNEVTVGVSRANAHQSAQACHHHPERQNGLKNRAIHPLSALRLPLCAFACLALATALLSSGFAQAQNASGLGPYDGPNITIDVGSMRVLSSNRAFDAWYPASTTKLMTAYVVFQAVREGRVTMQSPVTISANAAAQPPSKAGLAVGQVLTVENALRVLMVKSANDIAVALAESVAGSEPAFIDQMNSAARALGMSRSTFTNPHGLPDHGQVTTAYDLALLTLALLRDYPERNDFYSMGAVQLGRPAGSTTISCFSAIAAPSASRPAIFATAASTWSPVHAAAVARLITVTLGARSGLERAAASAHQLDEGFRRGGGLFGDVAGTPLADFRPSGSVQTTATRMRPIVCQSPRVRPTFEEIAGQFGTSGPGFNPTATPALSPAMPATLSCPTPAPPAARMTAPTRSMFSTRCSVR
jgi:D-alanyl-D-alanine carboxypeptidase